MNKGDVEAGGGCNTPRGVGVRWEERWKKKHVVSVYHICGATSARVPKSRVDITRWFRARQFTTLLYHQAVQPLSTFSSPPDHAHPSSSKFFFPLHQNLRPWWTGATSAADWASSPLNNVRLRSFSLIATNPDPRASRQPRTSSYCNLLRIHLGQWPKNGCWVHIRPATTKNSVWAYTCQCRLHRLRVWWRGECHCLTFTPSADHMIIF